MTTRLAAQIDQGNIGFITAIRGIAAVFVTISHIWYQIWPAAPAPFGYGDYPEGATALLTGWLYYGHFGVVAFIFVSGFCLMMPVLRYGGIRSLGDFFFRRCRRIMPPYFAALLLSILLATTVLSSKTGTQWDISIPVTWKGVVSHLFLVQHLFEPTQINYPLWSISVEFHLYILFPLFIWLWSRLGIWAMTGIITALVFLLAATLIACQIEDVPPSFLGLIVHFIFGMACCHIIFSGTLPARIVSISGHAAFGFFASLLVVCGIFGHARIEEFFYAIDLIVIAALFCSFIHLSFRPSAARRMLEKSSLIKLGDMSYSLYLTHAPVIQILWLVVASQNHKTQDFTLLLCISVPGTLAVSYLFYLLFEHPFLSRSDAVGSS